MRARTGWILAAALLTLLADRAPVPLAAKIKEGK